MARSARAGSHRGRRAWQSVARLAKSLRFRGRPCAECDNRRLPRHLARLQPTGCAPDTPLSFLPFTIRVVKRMRDVGLMRTASSLSFTTLLAIVPIVTIALAFVAQFPIFEQWISALETFLVKNALPGYAAGVVHQYVLTFAEQATRLTRVSILIIAVTAALAIFTVDREINLIW